MALAEGSINFNYDLHSPASSQGGAPAGFHAAAAAAAASQQLQLQLQAQLQEHKARADNAEARCSRFEDALTRLRSAASERAEASIGLSQELATAVDERVNLQLQVRALQDELAAVRQQNSLRLRIGVGAATPHSPSRTSAESESSRSLLDGGLTSPDRDRNPPASPSTAPLASPTSVTMANLSQMAAAQTAKRQLDVVSDKLAAAEGRIRALEGERAEWEAARAAKATELAAVRQQNHVLEQELAALQSLTQLKTGLEGVLEKKQHENNLLQGQVAALRASLEQVDRSYQAELGIVRGQLEGRAAECLSLERGMMRLQQDKQALESRLHGMETTKGVQSESQSSLERQIGTLRDEIAGLKALAEMREGELHHARRRHEEELAARDAQIDTLSANLEQQLARLERLHAELRSDSAMASAGRETEAAKRRAAELDALLAERDASIAALQLQLAEGRRVVEGLERVLHAKDEQLERLSAALAAATEAAEARPIAVDETALPHDTDLTLSSVMADPNASAIAHAPAENADGTAQEAERTVTATVEETAVAAQAPAAPGHAVPPAFAARRPASVAHPSPRKAQLALLHLQSRKAAVEESRLQEYKRQAEESAAEVETTRKALMDLALQLQRSLKEKEAMHRALAEAARKERDATAALKKAEEALLKHLMNAPPPARPRHFGTGASKFFPFLSVALACTLAMYCPRPPSLTHSSLATIGKPPIAASRDSMEGSLGSVTNFENPLFGAEGPPAAAKGRAARSPSPSARAAAGNGRPAAARRPRDRSASPPRSK